MFMQAWSSYGVQWPVIYHFLGIRPDMPDGRLYVVPDVPEPWPHLSVARLRVGTGAVTAAASVDNKTYTTRVSAPSELSLTLGHTLPEGSEVSGVALDGVRTDDYEVVETARGSEVRVETTGGSHTLEVVRS